MTDYLTNDDKILKEQIYEDARNLFFNDLHYNFWGALNDSANNNIENGYDSAQVRILSNIWQVLFVIDNPDSNTSHCISGTIDIDIKQEEIRREMLKQSLYNDFVDNLYEIDNKSNDMLDELEDEYELS